MERNSFSSLSLRRANRWLPQCDGNGVVLDPCLLKEIGGLREIGVKVERQSVYFQSRALILPYHRMIELAAENAPGRVKIGPTSRALARLTKTRWAVAATRADLLIPNC